MPKAMSKYKQIRFTATEEMSGRLSYRVMVKPQNVDWSTSHLLVSDSIMLRAPIETTEDVVQALLTMLSEQLLPESHNG